MPTEIPTKTDPEPDQDRSELGQKLRGIDTLLEDRVGVKGSVISTAAAGAAIGLAAGDVPGLLVGLVIGALLGAVGLRDRSHTR